METRADERQQARVVLVPCMGEGHATPMLQLGAILHSSYGFSITVIYTGSSSYFPDPSNHPQFQFLSLPGSLSAEEKLNFGDFASGMLDLNTNFRIPLKDSLRLLVQQSEEGSRDEKVACLIYDGLLYYAEEVAAELAIPCMLFLVFSATNLRLNTEYPRLLEEGHIPLQESKLLDLVPGLHPLRFKDLSIYKFPAGGYDQLIQLLVRAAKHGSSSAVIINTIEMLEQEPLMALERLYKIPILAVGPLHKFAPPLFMSSSLLEEDTTCIAWLDKKAKMRSVLYVSLGSIATIDQKDLTEIAWGLANSGQPFLWVIRPNSVRGSEMLPEGFVESVGQRGLIIKWAPQRKVLQHESIGGFLSHSGWNSVLESISEGVPMICTPSFADHRLYSRYLSHTWKVGIELVDMERAEIARAVEKLMVSEEGDIMRRRAADLKHGVEDSTREGGSSKHSLNNLVDLIRLL